MSEEELKTQLGKEIRSLCETNSSVMTYMECLMRKYEQLQSQLQQKENIIKKVREYIENTYEDFKNEDGSLPMTLHDQKILEILDKENK